MMTPTSLTPISPHRHRRHWLLSVRHQGEVHAHVVGDAGADQAAPSEFRLAEQRFADLSELIAAVNDGRVPGIPWRLRRDLSRFES